MSDDELAAPLPSKRAGSDAQRRDNAAPAAASSASSSTAASSATLANATGNSNNNSNSNSNNNNNNNNNNSDKINSDKQPSDSKNDDSESSTSTKSNTSSTSAKSTASAQHEFTSASSKDVENKKSNIVVKVAMIGDSQIGKTSLMVKYVEGSFDEDYIQTLGVNFMEKTITLRGNEITFSIWDLGGQREFVSMLPLVCNEAVALLFMFDLSRKSTLSSIKEWYRQARGFNKTAIPFLIGTKYDLFVNLPLEEQTQITKLARKFAKAMQSPLIFCSTREGISVQKIFKIVLARVFDLNCTIKEITTIGDPIIEFSQQ